MPSLLSFIASASVLNLVVSLIVPNKISVQNVTHAASAACCHPNCVLHCERLDVCSLHRSAASYTSPMNFIHLSPPCFIWSRSVKDLT